MMKKFLPVAAILLFCSTLFGYSGPFYIATNGSDTASGAFATPFKTLQKAVGRMAPGTNITSATAFLMPGKYTNGCSILSNKSGHIMSFVNSSNKSVIIRPNSLNRCGFFITNIHSPVSNQTAQLYFKNLTVVGWTNSFYFGTSCRSNTWYKCTIYSNYQFGIWFNNVSVFDGTKHGNILVFSNIFGPSPNAIIGSSGNGYIWGGGIRSDIMISGNVLKNKFMGLANGGAGVAFYNQSQSNYISQNNFTNLSSGSTGVSIGNNGAVYNTIISNTFKVSGGSSISANNSHGAKILWNNIWYGGISVNTYSNYIANNTMTSNLQYQTAFITINQNAYGTTIASNKLLYSSSGTQKYGILCLTNAFIYNNLMVGMQPHGIKISGNPVGSPRSRIFNNTIVNTLTSNGIFLFNNFSGTLFNNILMSNARYGIASSGSTSASILYNSFYHNSLGVTNGGSFIWGNGNSTNQVYLSGVTSYTISSKLSSAFDSGYSNQYTIWTYNGTNYDKGYKESPFVYGGPYYVSANGSDTGKATFSSPYLTIQKGVTRLSSGIGVTSATLYIAPGTYNESVYFKSNRTGTTAVVSEIPTSNRPIMNGLSAVRTNAFFMQYVTNTLMQGLQFRGYSNAILHYRLVNRNTVRNCVFKSNYKAIGNLDGDYNSHSMSNSIMQCKLTNNIYGVYTDGSVAYTVFSNLMSMSSNSSSIGIYNNRALIYPEGYFVVKYNTMKMNSSVPIGVGMDFAFVSEGHIIKSNYVSGFNYGIEFVATTSNETVMNNWVTNSGLTGVAIGVSYGTVVKYNDIRKSGTFGILGGASGGVTISSNNIYSTGAYPVYLGSSSTGYVVRKNRILNTGVIYCEPTANNNFISGNFCSNAVGGIYLRGYKNTVASNTIYKSTTYGIQVNGNSNIIHHNAIFGNSQHGILISGPFTNVFLYNNTIASNGKSAGYNNVTINTGVRFFTAMNNIVYSSPSGYGFYHSTNQMWTNIRYNNVYGNALSNYGGNLKNSWSKGISSKPLFVSYGTGNPNFLRVNDGDWDIDTGTNLGYPFLLHNQDIGWVEYYPKYIPQKIKETNVLDKLNGSKKTFAIKYTNKDTTSLALCSFYRKIPTGYRYVTNSMSSPSGWINEVSTNTLPAQSFLSNSGYTYQLSGYLTQQQASKVKWVRWRKTYIGLKESGVLYYTIIKQ